MPDGPQGPQGATILKYDLLSNSQAGLNYQPGHLGAFVPKSYPAGRFNHELQEYVPQAAVQDQDTNEITITAKKDEYTGKITSLSVRIHPSQPRSIPRKSQPHCEFK